jgi:hypothetical protein
MAATLRLLSQSLRGLAAQKLCTISLPEPVRCSSVPNCKSNSCPMRAAFQGLWPVVHESATKAGILNIAPHDPRRTCARLCQLPGGETAFLVSPSPQTCPPRLTRRKSFPPSIPAAAIQHSSSARTQSGIGTVRTWPPLPTRSTMAQ